MPKTPHRKSPVSFEEAARDLASHELGGGPLTRTYFASVIARGNPKKSRAEVEPEARAFVERLRVTREVPFADVVRDIANFHNGEIEAAERGQVTPYYSYLRR
jgi:hypothetical protein